MNKKRRTLYDLTGQKFKRLTVVKFIGYGGDLENESMWEVQCSCGNTIELSTHRFKRGKTGSCGCLHSENSSKRAMNLSHRLLNGEASFNTLLSNYKYNAEKRNINFELSNEQFRQFTKSNCHYCNIPPLQVVSMKKKNGDYLHNGIDRKDSNLGYTIDNCVPCCTVCNKAKMKLSYDEFSDWIKKVYHFFVKGEK